MKIRNLLILITTVIIIASMAIVTSVAVFTISKQGQDDIEKYRAEELEKVRRNLKDMVYMSYNTMAKNDETAHDKMFLEKYYGVRLKDAISIVEPIFREKAKMAKEGKEPLAQAKKEAFDAVKSIRYDNGTGYFWINDTTLPYPRMIMHPTLPELDGKVLDDPKFSCALGNKKNLFQAFAEVTKAKGEGFVDYFWPKPTQKGLTALTPKLSYVKLFPEWNIIIGTGIYVDDAVADAMEREKEGLNRMRYDNGTGYFWITDKAYPYPKMIMHPTIPELDGKVLDDPKFNCALGKQKNLFQAMVEVCDKDGEGFIDYMWPKPTKEGLSKPVRKLSFVKLYKPWNWIIGTGVYIDNIEQETAFKALSIHDRVNKVIRNFLLISIIVLIAGITTVILFARSLTVPISRLADSIRRIKKEGIYSGESPVAGTVETKELGEIFNSMLSDLRNGDATNKALLSEVEEHANRLEEKVEERTVELRESESELKKAKEAAEEANRTKTDFLNTVSHELRTPLTSILGFASIIRKKFDDTIFPAIKIENKKTEKSIHQVRSNIDIILTEGQRLTNLINNVLDLAKMEAGRTEWKMERLNVSEIIDRAQTAAASLFEQKGLQLIMDVEKDLPSVYGDMDRFIQVMLNLISNAVKFTPQGSVTCAARKIKNEIVLSVTDSGIGIAPEDQPKVFEKFKQVGDTLTDKPSGTGLGLPICREIVEHYGGRIWVESESGKGSKFSFAIPLRQADIDVVNVDINILLQRLKDHVAAMPLGEEPGEKTILVVDDDASIRELLRQELETDGYKVIEAADGMEGVNKAKSNSPNLIILDVMMPQMNGFDAAAVLKNDPLTMHIPIIILSVVEDKERGYRLGVDKYFNKPVNTEELLKEIGVLISEGVSKKKVMVVDENESTAKTLKEVLETKGYSVVSACSGKECLEKAISEKPDMIIIDTLLSDTHDIVKTLRFEKGLENIYFLFVEGSRK